MHTQRIGGYTLIELLTILNIAAVLSFLGIGGFSKLVSKTQQFNIIHETITSLNFARTVALKRYERVGFCNIANDRKCSDDWNGGHLIGFIDSNQNRAYDSNEEIIFQQTWNSRYVHTKWNNRLGDKAITYQTNGRIVSNGTLYLSDENDKLFAKLIVNNSGRFRLEAP